MYVCVSQESRDACGDLYRDNDLDTIDVARAYKLYIQKDLRSCSRQKRPYTVRLLVSGMIYIYTVVDLVQKSVRKTCCSRCGCTNSHLIVVLRLCIFNML